MRATLENWSITRNPDPYLAPEMRVPRLQGEVYGHLNHQDGKHIVTSSILGKTKTGLIKTKNTTYKLGKVAVLYEDAFPQARKRLLESLSLI